MPIFEFVCQDCEKLFEELIFGFNTDDVVCPTCGSEHVRKKMSTFASKPGAMALRFRWGAVSLLHHVAQVVEEFNPIGRVPVL